jgi:hypothetical protein
LYAFVVYLKMYNQSTTLLRYKFIAARSKALCCTFATGPAMVGLVLGLPPPRLLPPRPPPLLLLAAYPPRYPPLFPWFPLVLENPPLLPRALLLFALPPLCPLSAATTAAVLAASGNAFSVIRSHLARA